MAGYICVTHSTTHREETERLCRVLGRYGFRYRQLDETATPALREELLGEAAALLAVTGVSENDRGYAALSSDVERCLARRVTVLCLSVQDCALDDRFCNGAGASLIPFTVGRMPDRHSVALFLHRLFVRHLAALPGCFHADRCVDDGYGRLVSLAVRAHRGEGAACYALGRAYEAGDRVPTIEHEAALWITRAAELGVPDARIHMGELHLTGKCRHPDPAEAVRLFTKAAEAGDVRGYYHRALCALYGLGIPKDPAVAATDLYRAACAGYAPALYRLGLLYRDGVGVAEGRSFEAALHCLYAACRVGTAVLGADRLIAAVPATPPDEPLASAMFTRTGSTRPWTPFALPGEIPLAWTPVEPRPGTTSLTWKRRSGSRPLPGDALIEKALSAGVATPECAATVDGAPLPPPPSLYSRRVGRRPLARTLRHMRRTELWRLSSRRAAVADPLDADRSVFPGQLTPGYAPPHLRANEAVAARCFSRARYATDPIPPEAAGADWQIALFGASARSMAATPSSTLMPTSGPAHSKITSDNRDSYIARAAFDVPDAAVALGYLLACGDPSAGYAPHPTRAVVWYRYAALGGSAEAFRRLGDVYRLGLGLPPDRQRAAELYRLSAELGDPHGQFARAVACEQGIGTAQDLTEAFHRYRAAAEAGYAPAQNNLGGCYEYGLGVVPDRLAAVEWYTRAATAGQADAACRLGLCYESGRGVPADLSRAIRLYATAAAAGHAHALYRLGLCYERGLAELSPKADAPSFVLGASAAEGSTEADVSGIIALATPVSPPPTPIPEARRLTPHYAEAVTLWEAAAARGLPIAAYALALCYDHGHGVRVDAAEAVRYLTVAARAGFIQAWYRLGFCYLEGRGILPDAAEARRCFARVATLWETRRTAVRPSTDVEEAEALPVGAMTSEAAAAGALYMQGYCILYAVGEREAMHRHGPTGPTPESVAATPEPTRLAGAEEKFRRAADLGHVGALTALGDLYTYGLLTATSAADRAFDLYTEAARLGMMRVFTPDPTPQKAAPDAVTEGWLRDDAFRDSPVRASLPRAVAMRQSGDPLADEPLHALLTVAERTNAIAAEREAEGETADAELARVQVWRSLAGAAELGSTDALVAMAACTFFGHGTPENRVAARRLLERAETMDGGRIMASLWLGDLHRTGGCGAADPTEADEAYLRALRMPLVGSECGAYIIANRRDARRDEDRRARAEVLYRIATLRAVAFPVDPLRGDAFRFLVEAVLAGHKAAEDDLARMYAYDRGLLSATPLSGASGSDAPTVAPAHTPHLHARRREAHPERLHHDWMTDYYTALNLTPAPFRYTLDMTVDPATLPAYVTAPVTDALRVDALNYLGDCFFDGHGLPSDPAAAVACYRRVVSMKPDVPRGQPAPKGMTWAQYSLGWCLLKGVGTPRDDREAVRFLTAAARSHGDAAYHLADCYARGIGVDVPDDREAIKYYRKAHRLGSPRAAKQLAELEERLRRRTRSDD